MKSVTSDVSGGAAPPTDCPRRAPAVFFFSQDVRQEIHVQKNIHKEVKIRA